MSARDLIGSGGGGKGGGESARTPVEAPDSLRSRDFARVIDLISEGEIVGLVDGLKSVYLNEVPVQDASGNANFTNLVMDSRTGSQSQSYIPGIPAVENEVQVGAEVKLAVPLVRSIVSASINAVCVRISFPALSVQDMSNGDTNGVSVQIAIDVQAGSGPWVEQVNQVITGKATAKYVRQWRVELTGAGPWQVRVRRLTADSATTSLQNKTFWESYTEVIDAKLRYPNSALVALSVDSSQFNSIPSRAYHMRGLIIQVPDNYDPVTRTYTGIWQGKFKPAYSNNPAWVFYDLVLSNRYGLGQFIKAAHIDKWSLYAVARYCDELVPTGFGGMEPRFTCNLYLQTRQDAYRVLQDLASVFRGITFWAAGKLTASQDAPDDADALFTNANVIEGRFEYQGAAASSRHTVALVTWNDPDNFCRPQIEYVPDDNGISRFGIRQAEVSAIGCTSRGQAHRLGRWLLYSEAMESEVVSFKCGLDGVFIMPGSVVKVSDRLRNSKRAGGRIVSATANQVTVDSYQALGGVERLTVVQPDGALAESVVLGVVGNILTLQTALPFVPVPQSVWVLASDTVPEVFYRVVSIAEGEPGQIAVTAVLHRPDKYARIEQNLKLEPVARPPAAVVPAAPAAIQFTELLQNDAEQVTVKLLLGWDAVQGAREYRVRWRFSAGNWSEFNTSDAAYEIRNVPVGRVEVEVGSVGAMGVSARMTAASYTMLGDSAPPSLVSGLALSEPFAGTGLRAKWSRVPRATGYTVELRTDAGVLIRQLFIGDVTHFEYLAESMRADGGPWRSVTLKVRAENTRAQPGPWASLLATNPVPAALTGLLMTAGYDAVRFSCAPPADLDFMGLKVWAAAKSGFSVADDTFLVYDGPDTQVPITTLRDGTPLAGGVPVYVRAAAYDAFGKTGLNVSSELSCTPLKVLAGLKPGEIHSELIQAIDAVKVYGTLKDAQVEGLAALKGSLAAGGAIRGEIDAAYEKALKAEKDVAGTVSQTDFAQLKASTDSTNGNVSAMNNRLNTVEVSVAGKASSSSLASLEAKVVSQGEVNLIDLSGWKMGSFAWPTNSGANENAMITSVGPDGHSSALWQCIPSGDGDADGGWNAYNALNIDPTKTYRFAVPVMREGLAGFGSAFWGIQYNTVCDLNTRNANPNPYFAVWSGLELNKWYLAVGYVFPAGSTGNTNDGAGFFDLETGQLVQGGVNYCWVPGQTVSGHRAFLYYCNSAIPRQYFAPPEVTMVGRSSAAIPKLSTLGATKTELAARIDTVNKAIVDATAGKASSESLTALDARVVANANTVTAQVARLDQAVSDANTAAASSSSNLSAKIAAGQSGNLLINADFLLANGNMPAAWRWDGNFQAPSGGFNMVSWGVLPTNNAATWFLSQLPGNTGNRCLIGQTVAIEGGKTYAFSVYSGAHRTTGWLEMGFRNAAGGYTGSFVTGPVQYNAEEKYGGSALSGYKRLCLIGVAPADAVQVEVHIGRHGTNPGHGDSYHFFTRPMLEVVPADAKGPTEWRTGQTDVSAINNAATKTDLSAQVARLDSVITDVAGKASASSVQAVVATVGAQSASITQLSQAQATTDGKLLAKWGVVLSGETADGRKKLSGLQAFNDGTTSGFVITADQVLIGDLSNLVSDPNYMDMAWWGRSANNPIEDGGAPGWAKTARRLTITPAFNGESLSKPFPVTPGAVYRLEVVIYSNNAVGSIKVHMHIPGIRWAGFDGSWNDAPTIVGDGTVAGARWFSTEVTFPTNAFASTSNIRIVSNISSGSWVVGLVSVVRVSDSTLIAGGAITAEKIKVDTLQAVTARTGSLIVDGALSSGGFTNAWAWPAAGTTGFHLSGQGLLIGSPNYGNGGFLHYNVAASSFEIRNGTINAATINGGTINGAQINVKSANSGRRVEITNSLIAVFDENNIPRCRFGIWD